MGIEPTTTAWKAVVLPLNYTRIFIVIILNSFFPCSGLTCLQLFSPFLCSTVVEATRRPFIDALLVAVVLPLNYTRIFIVIILNSFFPCSGLTCLQLFSPFLCSTVVEATRRPFIDALLVAVVLPLNYTRIFFILLFFFRFPGSGLTCLQLFSLFLCSIIVEATRRPFIDALLVAVVLPLNYTRNLIKIFINFCLPESGITGF